MSLTDHTLIEHLVLFSAPLQPEINYSDACPCLYVFHIYRAYGENCVIKRVIYRIGVYTGTGLSRLPIKITPERVIG